MSEELFPTGLTNRVGPGSSLLKLWLCMVLSLKQNVPLASIWCSAWSAALAAVMWFATVISEAQWNPQLSVCQVHTIWSRLYAALVNLRFHRGSMCSLVDFIWLREAMQVLYCVFQGLLSVRSERSSLIWIMLDYRLQLQEINRLAPFCVASNVQIKYSWWRDHIEDANSRCGWTNVRNANLRGYTSYDECNVVILKHSHIWLGYERTIL